MRQFTSRRRRLGSRIAIVFGAATVLMSAMGLSCDSDAAATFRQEATGPIGEGVKTIMNGVLDGLIASIEDAGDGAADTTTSRTTR